MDSLQPHLYYEKNRPFTNFHGNVQCMPARYYDVWNIWDDSSSPEARRWLPGMRAIQEIIRDAEKRDMPVRALGAGWSLSQAAVTSGCLLNTKPLNVIEVGVRPEHCTQEYLRAQQGAGESTPADLLVFAQCGASIAELNRALESRGLALPTSGASNGQTICGAMSTGTHGSAWKFGAVQEMILGLHLIGEGGESYWIERASAPVMTGSFCKILQAQLVRDDRLFNAALVSFGSFGVIHAVVLKAERLYLLESHLAPCSFDAAQGAMLDIENRAGKLGLVDIRGAVQTNPPYHFEVMLNPFAFDFRNGGIAEKHGQSAAYVRYIYKYSPPDLTKYSPTGHLLGPKPDNEGTSTDAFSMVDRLGDLAPLYARSGVADEVSKKVIEDILQPDDPVTHRGTVLTPGGTFGTTQLAGVELSCELGFARQDIPKAIEVIIKEIHAYPLSCLPSLRFVGASSALLAPTFFGPYTCMMEFPAALSDRTLTAYGRLWNALEKNGVSHTFHWGQCLNWGATPGLARKKMESVYGQRLSDWLQARKQFLHPKARQTTFANQMLMDCGLVE